MQQILPTQTIKNPGDAGYTGGMIFSHNSRILQCLEYGAVTTGTITDIQIAGSPDYEITVTDNNLGLTNGDLLYPYFRYNTIKWYNKICW